MKIKEIDNSLLKEADNPDRDKIIRSYEKRIDILETIIKKVDRETKEFAYIEPSIITIIDNVKQLARFNNVDVQDQVDRVIETMQQLSEDLYNLREAFTDAIYQANSEIEKLQYED